MAESKIAVHGHRFPAAIISCAVRWYFRFRLSLRDIEELLFERGIVASYAIRLWCDKATFARRAKQTRPRCGTIWQFVRLRSEPYLLWRTVGQYGPVMPVFFRSNRRLASRYYYPVPNVRCRTYLLESRT
jgi:putative transposase